MTRPAVLSAADQAQILRFWQGFMTEREIAQHLGLHTATVRTVILQQAVAS